MKKIRKKNQLILTLLAIMIVAAGYFTYLPQKEQPVSALDRSFAGLSDLSEEDLLSENMALEQAQYSDGAAVWQSETETVSMDDQVPGQAVLTWSEQIENRLSEAELGREQVRARNEETLNSIINNTNLSEKQRQDAADNLLVMMQNAQKEANIEAVLETKGISSVLVTIQESGVDVLVGKTSLTDAERAQIEDSVKREAGVDASEIVISLVNEVNTSVVTGEEEALESAK